MVIVEKTGFAWNFLNIVGVAIVIYFTWYLLNRYVAPFSVKTATV